MSGRRRRPSEPGEPSLTSALAHPADRRRSRYFDRLAERGSFVASSPLFFLLCAALIAVWALGFALGFSDRVESAAAGLMSAVTLILVAFLKNAELRAERALQQKLDAIASALLADRRGHDDEAASRLAASIGVHDEI